MTILSPLRKIDTVMSCFNIVYRIRIYWSLSYNFCNLVMYHICIFFLKADCQSTMPIVCKVTVRHVHCCWRETGSLLQSVHTLSTPTAKHYQSKSRNKSPWSIAAFKYLVLFERSSEDATYPDIVLLDPMLCSAQG